jgi:hypothetical protein
MLSMKLKHTVIILSRVDSGICGVVHKMTDMCGDNKQDCNRHCTLSKNYSCRRLQEVASERTPSHIMQCYNQEDL